MTVHASRIEVDSRVQTLSGAAIEIRPTVYRAVAKRVFDLAVVILALPVLLPFFAIISIFIARDGHPAIFRQERIGKDGRRFMLFKFRTMVPNAEALLEEYLESNPEAKAEWESKQKLSDDPRVTKVGHILRRTSLDELPQLVNVLIGEMSLVGPRPMMPSQQALYPGQCYYNLRPGLTGSWQVSARNQSSFADRARYDDLYDANLSFGFDLKLMFQTIAVVLRGTGV